MKKRRSNETAVIPKSTVLSKIRRWTATKKALAIFLIFGLAASDTATLWELFSQLDNNNLLKWIHSITLAVCLEGIPTFMGISLSKLLDRTNYKKNDVINAGIGFAVGSVGIVLAFWMTYHLRYSLIQSYGGIDAFMNGTYASGSSGYVMSQSDMNNQYLNDWVLMYLPFATSILAFVASWIMFPSNSHSYLEMELDELHQNCIDLESAFHIARNTMELARVSLWKDLAESDTNMPRATNTFRKECYARIRNLLFHDCMKKYPGEIQRFNVGIERELARIIQDMADHTTIPDDIGKIDLQKLLQEYDKKATPINSWGCETATEALKDDLKQLLNNAIVVAQFKSTAPQNLEGRKW